MDKELDTITIGIVGHIDHGKTTLLHKLSGKWTDTHSEELKRGITIKLGYADITLYNDSGFYNKSKGKPVRNVSFVDAPGHEVLMGTMLNCAAMIDVAVLVVAVNEGIKPQTIEHLLALQAKGVKHLVVAQNKIDLVSKDVAMKNYEDIKKLLAGKYENAFIVPVSALQEINLDALYEFFAEVKIERKESGKEPFFIVARSFDVNRPGTKPSDLKGSVLGGTILQGKLSVGDEIEIKPGRIIKEAHHYNYKTINTKISKLFKGSKEVSDITPGGSFSIETELDMALAKSDALVGCVVSLKNKLPQPVSSIKLNYNLFSLILGEKEQSNKIKLSENLMFSVHTSMTLGLVKKIDSKNLDASLKIPIIASKGDMVAIGRNVNNHWRLIGYGEIV